MFGKKEILFLCRCDSNKEKNLDFPEIYMKKKTKPDEIGIFKFEIPWDQCSDGRTEIVVQLKNIEFDAFFGSEVKIICDK